jgi:fructose-bisphosphate aldolase class II
VHGVYKPGNVKLRPELLQSHQKYVKEKASTKGDKPVYLVCTYNAREEEFEANTDRHLVHGGSGSSVEDFREAISYGVVKVNLDTDMQWAYLSGVRDFVQSKKDYLQTQVGNPDGDDKPNKKYYDPRNWVREGEKTMTQRVKTGLEDFLAAGKA